MSAWDLQIVNGYIPKLVFLNQIVATVSQTALKLSIITATNVDRQELFFRPKSHGSEVRYGTGYCYNKGGSCWRIFLLPFSLLRFATIFPCRVPL